MQSRRTLSCSTGGTADEGQACNASTRRVCCTWYPSLSSSALRLAMRLGVFVRRSYALRSHKRPAPALLTVHFKAWIQALKCSLDPEGCSQLGCQEHHKLGQDQGGPPRLPHYSCVEGTQVLRTSQLL